jgi:hypothetical protein
LIFWGRLVLVFLICVGGARAQLTLTGVGGPAAGGGGTPTLNVFFGKNGMDLNRSTGSGGSINNNRHQLDPSGYPHAVTSGSLLTFDGEWPDAPLTTNLYPNNCTSPCISSIKDSAGNSLTQVPMTASGGVSGANCKDADGIDHGIFYEPNSPANISYIQEIYATGVTNTSWNPGNWYNIATASPVDGSSTCTTVTPANNTAPNISGAAITLTGSNDLVLIRIDEVSANNTLGSANTWNSVTVPANCTLREENIFLGHALLSCLPGVSGSYTPRFTVSQTTHSTFVIMAAAFKSGSGGSAPGAGTSVLLSAQDMVGASATTTRNVACPTATTTFVVADDAAAITSVTDSNGDTFTTLSIAGARFFYKTGISIANPNTFTVTITNGASTDLPVFFCTNATGLSALTAGGTSTQQGADAVSNFQTEATGSLNCQGASGSLVTCNDLPTETPSSSGTLVLLTGSIGTGPALNCTVPSGCVNDYPSPPTLGAAGVVRGDVDDYTNGDITGHFWESGTAASNFTWQAEQNASQITVLALGLK